MATIGGINIKVEANSARASASLRQTAKDLRHLKVEAVATSTAFGGLRASLGGLTGAMGARLGALGGGFAAFSFLKDSVIQAEEAEQSSKKLAAVLKATGHAAGMTGREMEEYALHLQRLTGIDDDLIVSGEAVLATFRNISGDTFKEATQAALDMSAVMGQDLQSSIVQVGKALNDPIEGMNALRRVGVSFSDEQKEQIRQYQEVNDLAKAQGVILDELANEFGGAAASMSSATKTLAADWSNLKEAIGATVMESHQAETVLGGLDLVIQALTRRVQKFNEEGIRYNLGGPGKTLTEPFAKDIGVSLGEALKNAWKEFGGAVKANPLPVTPWPEPELDAAGWGDTPNRSDFFDDAKLQKEINAAAQEHIDALREEAETFNMTAREARIYRMEQDSLPDAAIDHARAIDREIVAMERKADAMRELRERDEAERNRPMEAFADEIRQQVELRNRLLDEARKPGELFDVRMRELKGLHGKGLLDDRQLERLEHVARRDILGLSDRPQLAPALARGSREAQEAIARAQAQTDPVVRVARDQLAEEKKQTAALREIAAKPPVQFRPFGF